jgi:hypothetical protein
MTDTPPMLPKPTVHGTGAAFVWVALAVAVFAGVLLFFFNPAETRFYPRCMMKAVSGLDCPGCGGLRATHQLLHGNVREAFALNPLFMARPANAFPWSEHDRALVGGGRRDCVWCVAEPAVACVVRCLSAPLISATRSARGG